MAEQENIKKMVLVKAGVKDKPNAKVIKAGEENMTVREILESIAEAKERLGPDGAREAENLLSMLDSHRLYIGSDEIDPDTSISDLNFNLTVTDKGTGVYVLKLDIQEQSVGGSEDDKP